MKALVTAAVLLMLPAIALAQPDQTYVAVQAGGSWVKTTNYTNNAPSNVRVEYKNGYAAAVRLGKRFDQNWRIELEAGYAKNKADKISDLVTGAGPFQADGNVKAVSLMVNMLYDFSPRGRWHPYVGGGLGATQVSLNNVGQSGYPAIIDDSHKGASYQAIAGIEMDLTNTAALYASYHFIGTQLPRYQATNGNAFSAYYKANVVSIGVRWFL